MIIDLIWSAKFITLQLGLANQVKKFFHYFMYLLCKYKIYRHFYKTLYLNIRYSNITRIYWDRILPEFTEFIIMKWLNLIFNTYFCKFLGLIIKGLVGSTLGFRHLGLSNWVCALRALVMRGNSIILKKWYF